MMPLCHVSRAARRCAVALLLAALALSTSGCAIRGSGSSPAPISPASATPLGVTVTPTHGTSDAWTTDTMTVTATAGTVTNVTLSSPTGSVITGSLVGAVWTPSRTLLPNTAYTATVTSTVTGADGVSQTVVRSSRFATTNLTPAETNAYKILYSGPDKGVGIPIAVQFDSPISDKAQRATIEKQLKVTSTPAVAGSWGWIDSQEVQWRPQGYWAPNTMVHLSAEIGGLPAGAQKFVAKDSGATYSVAGTSRVLKVNTATHRLTAWQDGALVKTILVTNGKPGMESRSGVKVISEKFPTKVMDSSTVGVAVDSPDGYQTTVQWAQRITWTGEFLHSAPWSVASQGNDNVSHGCTGMSTENASWLYNFTRIGTPVEFVGNNRMIVQTEGIALWTPTWAEWQKLSAKQ